MRHSVFLSYRRADSSGHAGRLTDDLARRFGAEVVFRDIAAIDAGNDFVHALERALAEARVVLVLIGDTWLSETDTDGTRRLDNETDYVRREVGAALARDDLVVVPVLVEGAAMPGEPELPEPLRPLARLQAIELSEGRWAYDLQRLAAVLEQAGIRRRRLPVPVRWLRAATLAVAIAAVGVGIWLWQASPPAVDAYTGLWRLPNGSYWTVIADHGRLRVEETHYDSRQVWKRGTGNSTRDGLEVELELVFDSRPYRYRYRLAPAGDGSSLAGTETELTTGAEKSVVLTRD